MPIDADAPSSPVFALGARLAERFVIRSQLGAGAFGSVYAAEDTVHGGVVALKRLTRVTGATIYRFKREFRALAGGEHPNLVRLHELFSEGEDWCFSMELVEGLHFDNYVLGPRLHQAQTPTQADDVTPEPSREDVAKAEPDLDKLRSTLPQLVSAIRALHAAGVVHRDLKPANVLVTPEGRVVVLDFGLATESDPDAQKSVLGLVMGTPTYMSPEQALGRATTESSDWYSLGVMLFEALYGRPPFSGTVHDVLTAKLSPSTWRWPSPPPLAQDLDEICRMLMHPDPEQRPTGEAIARRLDARPLSSTGAAACAPSQATFVGREQELRVLRGALDALESSRAVVLRVQGPSGVGKSALVRHFLQTLSSDVVTLQGRCHERESVPYKTLDGVVDALTRYLGRLSVEQASLLLPRETQALCRLFPVFARLRLLADQPERQRSSSPHEDRRRGFAALREVLARIGDRSRLVVTIDDLQWGDLDSAEPLSELLLGPDPPRLLLVLAYRSNDVVQSPVLRALHDPSFLASSGDLLDLEVGPLGDADAITLAESLLPSDEQSRAKELARESGGIPLFLPELVRAQRRTRGAPVVSLEEALQLRVAQLSTGARRLLEIVAVAGRPLSRGVAWNAAQLDDEERQEAAQELVREHFVRSTASEDSALETFHDRVRESVVASLSEESLRSVHGALASALTASGVTDPEALAEHYRLAGKLAEARPAAIEAAARATDAFAFERAIALYRVAQEGAPSSERRLLTSKLADVLAYAGRGREAAAAYVEAVQGAAPKEARELRRRAAEQLLRCGAIDEGLALTRALLLEAGLSYPETRTGVLASVASQKLLLGLRGFSFRERALEASDDDDLARVDLCWTVGSCLTPIDVVGGIDFQTRHMRYALALGDAYRVARGLALAAMSLAAEGGRSGTKAKALAIRAAEIARRIDHPHAIGWSLSALSSVDWCAARWRSSLERSREAVDVFRSRSPESVWEVALPEILLTSRSLFFLGELSTFVDEARRCTLAAEERGDELIFMTGQSVAMSKAHLIAGQPERARRASADAISRWGHGEWRLQHQEDLRAQLHCDLYEGEGARALERISGSWKSVQSSLLLRAESERVQSYSLFVSAAIVAKNPKAAAHWLAKLSREKHPWARALAKAASAGVLALRGSEASVTTYDEAAVLLDALEMPLYAAAARRQRGERLGGSEGAALVEAADALLLSRGVVEPATWARMLVA